MSPEGETPHPPLHKVSFLESPADVSRVVANLNLHFTKKDILCDQLRQNLITMVQNFP